MDINLQEDELVRNPLPITRHCKVIEKEDGQYIHYIFKDLDDDSYYLVTQYPNWNQKVINIGEEGYLTFYLIIAGKSCWYDSKETLDFTPYKYTHLALVRFVKDSSKIIKKDNENYLFKVV